MKLPDKIMWVLVAIVMTVSAYFTFTYEQVTVDNVLEWLLKYVVIIGAGFFVGAQIKQLRLEIDELKAKKCKKCD